MNAPERPPDETGAAEPARQTAQSPAVPGPASVPANGVKAMPDELEALRSILTTPERERVARLEAQVAELNVRTQDRDALITAITPVLGDVIRQKIRDSREEMIEALYPIIGQLLGRAVAEAIRDLARTVDTRMRMSFDPQTVMRRLRARMAGVSESTLALRDALPFSVTELFLIHRESGLLLRHLSGEPEGAADSDLISGMLTAIRDFTYDAFGRGQEGQLDEIQYGTRRILIEASQHAYLAVVVDGIEPASFRATMRDRVIAFENRYFEALSGYDGNAARFAPVDTTLTSLMAGSVGDEPPASQRVTPGQRRIAVGLGTLLILCILASCAGGFQIVRNALNRPVPGVLIVVTATPGPPATATASPTTTPSPTASASPTRTPAPTMTVSATPEPAATSTPVMVPTEAPSPVAQIKAVAMNVRTGPGLGYTVLEIAPAGRTYTIVGRHVTGEWWQVCCTQEGTTGWLMSASALVTIEGDISQVTTVTGE